MGDTERTALVAELSGIREGLKRGDFTNEAAVRQAVVLRLLNALAWPIYDSRVVSPEFNVGGRRVDFALCHPASKPQILVEVKQVGQSDGAERQLFEYAFHQGVPIAVLTDGREWHFFLPAEPGDYGERRVYKLDLIERDLEECEKRLERYLSYRRVCSGTALEAARDDYKDVARKRQIRDALPQAWERLIAEEDELLLELIADRVESLCGYKPDPDTVAAFLHDMSRQPPRTVPTETATRRRELAPAASPAVATGKRTGEVGYSLQGRWVSCRNARDVLVRVIESLIAGDPSFLSRFESLPKHGSKRRFVAPAREDLYPDRPDLARDHSHQLRCGHWLGTNVSKRQIQTVLQRACDVAGMEYDRDLVVRLG